MAIKFYGGHQLNSKAKVYGTRQDFEVVEVDENGDPITEPSYMPENTNDGSTNWNTIGSNLPDTRNATELTWNLDNSVAPLTAFGTAGWMFQKVSEPSIQLGNSYIVSLKVLNATSDLTVRVVKGNTEYGYTPSMVTSLAEQTIPAGDYTNSPQLVSLTVDLPTSIGSWTNTLMIQFASAAGYGTFSIQDVLLTDGAPAASSLLAVTAPYAPNSANNVFVYNLNDMTESPIGLMPFDNDPNVYSQGFGFGITITEKYIVVGSSDDDDNNAYSGSVYVYDKTDLSAQPTKLLAFDGDEYDVFGRDIAYSDGYIFVGANGDDNEFGNASGAVYVYDEDDISAQPIKLTENTNNLGNRISAVNGKLAVSSTSRVFVYDINNLSAQPTIVGDGYIEDIMLTENKLFCGVLNDNGLAGRVDIYDINNLSANPTDIRAPDASSGDKFGSNLAFNNTKLYVSAYHDTDNGSKSGSVYVYNIADLSVQPTKITAPDGSSEDFFGRGIVADDNYVVIGAYGFDLNASNPHPFDGTGAIYVYDANNISAAPVKIIETTGHNDRFGLHMDIGEPVPPVRYYKTLATQYVPPPPPEYLHIGESGTYLYSYLKDDLSASPTITTFGTSGDYGMGMSVSGSMLAVGNYKANQNSGEVLIFGLNDLTTPTHTLVPSDIDPNDEFSRSSVSVTNNHVVVGAWKESESGPYRGAVYVYDRSDLSVEPVKLVPPNTDNYDMVGYSSGASDTHIAVAVRGYDGSSNQLDNSGAVYVYDASNLNASPTLIEYSTSNHSFAHSMALSDKHLVVGAYRWNDGSPSEGAAFVYDVNNLNASPVFLHPNDVQDNDDFGFEVAASNDYLVVGAWRAGTPSMGAVYVYDANDLSASPVRLQPSDLDSNDSFGVYLGIDGNTILVAATGDDGANNDLSMSGAVYVYDGTDLSSDPVLLRSPNPQYSGNFGREVSNRYS